MKKLIVGIALLALVAVGAAFLIPAGAEPQQEYLRIHIRANSNGEEDQAVKLDVKNAVVDFLIPILADAKTKRDAETILSSRSADIAAVATRTLEAKGYGYGARAEVRREEFPTRQYGEETFPAGLYDALIVELGSGAGDNWWCVAFPPLCFTPNGGKNIVYRSKIAEIIKNWKEQHENNG